MPHRVPRFAIISGILAGLILPSVSGVPALPPKVSTSGWSLLDLPAVTTGNPYWGSGFATGLHEVVATVSGRVVVFNSSDGTVRFDAGRPPTFNQNSYIYFEPRYVIDGNRLILSVADSGKLYLNELDLTTGTWLRSFSKAYPSGTPYPSSDPIVANGEIRVGAGLTEILRLNKSDWSVLPAIPLPYSSVNVVNPQPFGDGWYLGKTNFGSSLSFESNGAPVPVPLPEGCILNYGMGGQTGSHDYFVTNVEKDNQDCWLVYFPRLNGIASRILPQGSTASTTLGPPAIWENRYLVFTAKTAPSWNPIWRCLDLDHPSAPAVDLPLPPWLNSTRMGTSAEGPWIFASNTVNPASGGAVCHLDLPVEQAGSVVSVADAHANEQEGSLTFRVTATPAPSHPVTIHLATESGSATEGVDYEGWAGTVTLTPTQPTVDVSIRILQDFELEAAESFRLKISGVNGAWCTQKEAASVIIGTGFPKLAALDPIPNNVVDPRDGIPCFTTTRSGVVAYFYSNFSGSPFRLYFAPNDGVSWQEVTGFTPFAYSGQVTILGSDGDRICISGPYDNSSLTSRPMLVKVVDVAANQTLASFTVQDPRQAFFCEGGVVVFENGNAVFHSLPSGSAQWSVRAFVNRGRLTPNSSSTWLTDNSGIEVRRSSDGGLVRPLVKPLDGFGTYFFPLDSRDGVTVVGHDSGFSLHRFAEDGSDLYQFCPATVMTETAAITKNGIAFGGDQTVVNAFDTVTGAKLKTIPGTGYGLSGKGGVLALRAPGYPNPDTIERYVAVPEVPAPANSIIETGENLAAVPVSLRMAEPVAFPVSIRVLSCSSPADVAFTGTPVTLPAGQTQFTLPLRIVDDNVPEEEETVTVNLEVKGNGHTALYPLQLLIHDNDTAVIPAQPAERVRASSAAIAGAGMVTGGPIQSKIATDHALGANLPASATEKGWFGTASAATADLAFIGAPGAPTSTGAGAVYFYSRITGKMTKRLAKTGAAAEFGAVLATDSANLFVGAPGYNVAGKVYAYKLPTGTAGKTFSEPAPAATTNRFGTAMAGNGTSVWIGAPGSGTGAVYQFGITAGTLTRKISAPAEASANFGQAVALTGNMLAVGSPANDANSAVFLFNATTGALTGRIPSPFTNGGLHGASVAAFSNGLLAVGCPSATGHERGCILLYDIQVPSPRLIVCLEPEPAPSGNDYLALNAIGRTNSLSASGTKLSLISRISDPLATMEPFSYLDGVAHVIDLKDYQPMRVWQTTAPASRADVWHYALGDNHQPATREITSFQSGGRRGITLPALDSLRPGTVLLVECSSDLIHWETAAYLDGSLDAGWQSTGSAGLDIAQRVLWLPPDASGKTFSRVRCVAP